MNRKLKLLVFRTARSLGLFTLARRLTRDRLRILAYHGFATGDELAFRPELFISPETFARRLNMLKERGFSVLGLDAAVEDLRQGRIKRDSVVITIDDGYASTITLAAPLLARHGFPATVYITTYHVQKQTPVFDVVIGYILWRAGPRDLVLNWPPGNGQITVRPPAAGETLVDLGRSAPDEDTRIALCRALCEAAGISHDEIASRDVFRLMTPKDIGRLRSHGLQVGLHTHRHNFPADDEATCRDEIQTNQRFLTAIEPATAPHFCYPSGIYSRSQWPILESLGIRSSTTCDTGLVRVGDPPHGLKRFIDGEGISDVEFDAEICGFAELVRRFFR